MEKTGITTGILLAVTGLMMIMAPAQFVKVFVIVLGVSFMVNGIISLTTTRLLIADPAFRLDLAIRGWSSIVIGIMAVALPLIFAETVWTIMIYVLAVYLLVSAGLELYAVTRLRSEKKSVRSYVWEIIASLVIAVILFVMPAAIGLFVVRICGAVLVCAAAGLLVYTVKKRPLTVEPDSVEDV